MSPKGSLPRTVPGGAFGPASLDQGRLKKDARPAWGLDGKMPVLSGALMVDGT